MLEPDGELFSAYIGKRRVVYNDCSMRLCIWDYVVCYKDLFNKRPVQIGMGRQI